MFRVYGLVRSPPGVRVGTDLGLQQIPGIPGRNSPAPPYSGKIEILHTRTVLFTGVLLSLSPLDVVSLCLLCGAASRGSQDGQERGRHSIFEPLILTYCIDTAGIGL